jgi:hypothetical protein
MNETLRSKLCIAEANLQCINDILLDPSNTIINQFMDVINKYGTVEEINRKAEEAGKLENILKKLEAKKSPYLADLRWLQEQRDNKAFISMADYRRKILGSEQNVTFDERLAVTLEVSAAQYFPWIIAEAKQAILRQELMPGRFIRVRFMKEQEQDDDILAFAAAMKIIGATWCETLDTKGTDGANVHLGGPATITGYFGGVGQPNDYPLKWLDEYLYYYTNYGIKQVLNVNSGTIMLAYLLNKIGVDNEFKISVFMGNDNPYSILWTLMTARLLARDDGRTPLIGFNFSNSVNNKTIELCSEVRGSLGFEDLVRFEHHILETYKSIVCQPYDRRAELLEVARKVRNISAKHEGGDVAVEATRAHPSDILDYFIPKETAIANNLMETLLQNYLDKHDGVNHTANALTKQGLAVVAAWNLHQ